MYAQYPHGLWLTRKIGPMRINTFGFFSQMQMLNMIVLTDIIPTQKFA